MRKSYPVIKKFRKFATVGAISTSISLALNFIFLKIYETPLILTYVLIYAFTIVFSFVLNSKYTFSSHITLNNLLRYLAIYLTGMLIGVVLLKFYRWVLPFENWVLPFLVVPFTMLWNFNMADRFLRRPL